MSAIALAACSDDEGTDPGHDSAPAVTIYSYTPGSGYNADEDVKIRIAPNSKVKDIYYLSELTTAKQEYVAENGETRMPTMSWRTARRSKAKTMPIRKSR